jgi:hypothetical protein
MLFQYNMARSAHQNEVRDLRKAGLNPILSGTGGAGSATPSGASAKMESVEGAGVSSALEALTSISKALLTKQETELTKATTERTTAEIETEKQRPQLVRSQSHLATNQATNAIETNRNIEADTRLKTIGAKVALSELDKNQALTNLFKSQNLTQSQQTRLFGLNADQATEVLKGLRNDGAINESAYGKFLRYIDRGLETINKIPSIKSRR